jgi:LysR family transcriptional regulator, chromosome initiation inhibitor
MSLLDPKLEAFLCVVEAGTVIGAAQKLHLTQTGVTQRIRTLEKSLRTSLFIRSRRGMKMSEEGESLFRYCQAVLELEGKLLGEISGRPNEASVSLTLAGPTSIVSSRIIPACEGIYRDFPNLILSYRLDDRENRAELLKKGIAHLAILAPREVALEMDSKVLKPDRYVLVASAKWKRRKLAEIITSERMIDFDEGDSTTQDYLKKFGLLASARPERIFANTNFAVLSLLKAGIGYATLTEEVAAGAISRREITVLNQGKVYEDAQALAWYPRREMPAYFARIVEAIK